MAKLVVARIPDSEIERLKEEVSLQRLVELAGVELARQSKDLVGCCPFHDDRTPSLVISPIKNLWHCLGACQAGGSVIDWVMRVEGVSFRHAVELLRDGVAPTPVDGLPSSNLAAITDSHSWHSWKTPAPEPRQRAGRRSSRAGFASSSSSAQREIPSESEAVSCRASTGSLPTLFPSSMPRYSALRTATDARILERPDGSHTCTQATAGAFVGAVVAPTALF